MAVCMVTGMVLIHAPASALNNAGIEAGRMAENKMVVKKVRVGRDEYPYVSGQAFRRWWRETVHVKFGWTPSPVTREEKVAYTEGNPISYEEDDVFGYMVAPARGTEKGLVYRRVSPLKVTPLLSCFPNVLTDDFGVMARDVAEAEPVLFEQEFYSTVLKGAFSLMVSEVGVFMRGRAKDLPADGDAQEVKLSGTRLKEFEQRVSRLKAEATNKGAQIMDDRIILPDSERLKRAKEVLLALGELSGGAKLSGFLTDVTPRLVIAAILDCANHIFLDVSKVADGKVTLNTDAVEEIVRDYRDHLKSAIYLGVRKGFLDNAEYEHLKEWASDGIKVSDKQAVSVIFGTPKEVIEQLASKIDKLKM